MDEGHRAKILGALRLLTVYSFTEIQGQDRRPTAAETYGFLGWSGAGQHCTLNPLLPLFSLWTLTHCYLQMADKDNMWISKQEWQEQGSRALEKLGPRS